MKNIHQLRDHAKNLSNTYQEERSHSSFFSQLTQDKSRIDNAKFLENLGAKTVDSDGWRFNQNNQKNNKFLAKALTGGFIFVLNEINAQYNSSWGSANSENSALVRTIRKTLDIKNLDELDKQFKTQCLENLVKYIDTIDKSSKLHPLKSNNDLKDEIEEQINAIKNDASLKV
jgi:hypothetical protein